MTITRNEFSPNIGGSEQKDRLSKSGTSKSRSLPLYCTRGTRLTRHRGHEIRLGSLLVRHGWHRFRDSRDSSKAFRATLKEEKARSQTALRLGSRVPPRSTLEISMERIGLVGAGSSVSNGIRTVERWVGVSSGPSNFERGWSWSGYERVAAQEAGSIVNSNSCSGWNFAERRNVWTKGFLVLFWNRAKSNETQTHLATFKGHEILHEIYTSKRSKLNALNTRYPYYTRIYRHTSLTEFNKRA